jgi:hypothetical protein
MLCNKYKGRSQSHIKNFVQNRERIKLMRLHNTVFKFGFYASLMSLMLRQSFLKFLCLLLIENFSILGKLPH